ncbi:MAG: zinc-binding dehydrogenase [bacterium]
MKTRAATLCEIQKPLQIEELTIPALKPGQVLVKISYSGICHSQLNEILGLKGEDRFLPHTLGHEGSGIVESVGPDVKKVKSDDHVVLTWIKGTGADVPSTSYTKKDGSKVNSGAISTFMSKAVISENRLVKIPDQMPLKEAALLGCAVLTGAGIVKNTINLNSSDKVAVFGVGGIGLSAVLACGTIGADVIAIDIKDDKLELARKIGAAHLINANKEDPLNAINVITRGKGVDIAIESAGLKETMETAFKCTRRNGGLCILAGNLPNGENISIDPFELIAGKKIIGSWGGESMPDRDIPAYVNQYLNGKLRLESLITHIYNLEEINTAFSDLRMGKVGRALVAF